ncbi:MAG TPA: ATP-grasp domain-containing protein [Solirubrobacteraceae bacterium]|nr:ATP-grasp domain-containing protein [Solirubrobacteraceae bacterium]
MSTGSLLVVGSTSVTPWGHHQLTRIVEEARLRDLDLIGMDLAAQLESAGRASGENELFGELIPADIDDPDACVAAVAGRHEVSAVLTIRELSVAPVAAIARALGLRGNDPAVVERIRNKDRCRSWLRERGFAQPTTRLCSSPEEAVDFMAETGGPWIVKPRDAMASIGVSLVRGPDALESAIGRVDRDGRFLIETFVSGQEFSAEGVMLNARPYVLALTRKIMGEGPGVLAGGFVEIAHRQPSSLPADIADQARAEVARALTVAGVSCGIFHVEFWWNGSALVLGELHVRGGGDFIHLLVDETHPGLSMFGLLIDDLLGRPTDPISPLSGAAGATFLTFPPGGRITAIDGWEAVRAHKRVVAADLQICVGDTLAPATGSYDRAGAIVVVASTLEEVEAVTEELSSQVVVSTSQAARVGC